MLLSKIRVYELAKMLDMTNKELLELLHTLDIEVKSHMSSIDAEIAQLVEDAVKESTPEGKVAVSKPSRTIMVSPEASVADLADLLDV
jgi:translation initiation factor IF-2